jgi:hypothetical protein
VIVMPTYEICYLDRNGTLRAKFSAMCEGTIKAKVLAHAMKPHQIARLEVWRGATLVYARPQWPAPVAMEFVPGARIAEGVPG